MPLDYRRDLERDAQRIRESEDLSEGDKELLLEFKRDMKLNGAGASWIHKLLT